MQDHLHQYNIAAKAALTAYRRETKAAQDQLTQAMAPLVTRAEQEIANAARRFRDAMAAAETAYHEATVGQCRHSDACLCNECYERKFAPPPLPGGRHA